MKNKSISHRSEGQPRPYGISILCLGTSSLSLIILHTHDVIQFDFFFVLTSRFAFSASEIENYTLSNFSESDYAKYVVFKNSRSRANHFLNLLSEYCGILKSHGKKNLWIVFFCARVCCIQRDFHSTRDWCSINRCTNNAWISLWWWETRPNDLRECLHTLSWYKQRTRIVHVTVARRASRIRKTLINRIFHNNETLNLRL